ncbi:hypothetical protein AB0H37_07275 [Actinomadura sp. NPDC023710]|uniref:hypothetical protein n=1 Tax=Actinomadura sp. NPDC023710 TaxID=3158219 RepID=UPI0033C0F90B
MTAAHAWISQLHANILPDTTEAGGGRRSDRAFTSWDLTDPGARHGAGRSWFARLGDPVESPYRPLRRGSWGVSVSE